jgi:hypothetical protein
LCLAFPLTSATKKANDQGTDDEDTRKQEKREMATATEMTLALGRTVYGGDQSGEEGSDDKIEGRETRLSVTWRLTDQEQDLTLMASVLAEEAERALKQADRTVRKGPSPMESSSVERRSDVHSEPKYEATQEYEATTEQRPLATGDPIGGAYAGNGTGNSHSNGNSHAAAPSSLPASSCASAEPFSNGSKAPATNGSSGYNGSSGRSGSSGYPAYVPPITKPQQLAIQSHCTRHGTADWELRRLLWEMFGKKEPRELNKDQAGELLTALQREILSSAAESSVYAN